MSGSADQLPEIAYAARVAAERESYREETNVHDLPPICFYWLNRYILPQLASLGYASADEFFLRNLEGAYRSASGRRRFLSIGAGNCDTEVRLAAALRKSGATDFVIDCLDLNEQMLERGQALAAQQGMAAHIHPVSGDFNAWQPTEEYHAVLASHALHHVLRLEALFEAIHGSLRRNGVLVVSDMIGRNGHRRWPEALALVERFWKELPASHRYNQQLQRQETDYPDWDCCADGMGFEGIRAQDILPLLVDRFRFQFFMHSRT
jgi:2-polyprenyl-3-methyl-5-hydroxy-6-metoxy-1,4-benzoquinol methylase